jgi:hypothetical protein
MGTQYGTTNFLMEASFGLRWIRKGSLQIPLRNEIGTGTETPIWIQICPAMTICGKNLPRRSNNTEDISLWTKFVLLIV